MYKKDFKQLTFIDCEYLRKQRVVNKRISIIITQKDIDDAKKHLSKIYNSKIYEPFAIKLIILNKIC